MTSSLYECAACHARTWILDARVGGRPIGAHAGPADGAGSAVPCLGAWVKVDAIKQESAK